ncbi:hypothetical protein C8R45DRAFT_322286 [Mycena sanguinolenta]|nr:hypothetical protein C8R45DRAFT_322286 [Mycena sanguinolenta]
MFRGPRRRGKGRTVNISGGTGGFGGRGGVNGGAGGLGEGPRVKIVGRTVANIRNYSTPPTVHSHFRKIPLGDINLQQEIHPTRHSGVASLRKLHSAKISVDRERLDVTVAVYQGAGAKQEWRRDIARYRQIRHPNIVQLFGAASCGDVHAAVFHDDLIPLEHFEDLYRHSHFSRVYIIAYAGTGFQTVYDYFRTILRHYLGECTFLIRRSTGRLCLDIVPGDGYLPGYPSLLGRPAATLKEFHFLAGENSEGTVIDSLTLKQYHKISYWELPVVRWTSISTSATVNLGSVYRCPSHDTFDDVAEIAWLPNAKLSSNPRWYVSWIGLSSGELMANGWTRLQPNDIAGTQVWVEFSIYNDKFWLSQANHIFTTLGILSNFQDYVLVKRVYFNLRLAIHSEETVPTGFLFLCRPEDFRTGKSSVKWPDCPAYWSLNPSGAEQLAPEDAIGLGFPSFSITTRVRGYSWDASLYAGLRQFHQAKGFDPDSQDVARHLGHKLYQVSGPFARSEYAIYPVNIYLKIMCS